MRSRCLIFASLAALLLTGCRDRDVQAYRVPKETPPAATAQPGTPASGSAALTWTAPAHWEEQSTTALRRGSFAISNPDGEAADFSVIAFPGAAGGLLENMNRWRGQIGLPPVSQQELETQLQHLDVGPLHVDMVDFAGSADNVPTRIIGAVLSYGGETWFFKLMGPDALVTAEKPAFVAFIQSLREA